MNNLKRILTIALCSVLVVCTVPQFSLRSEAASTATYALYETLLNLSGYLTTRGYGIVHEYGSSIPSISDMREMSREEISNILLNIAKSLNKFGESHYFVGAGDALIKAMELASLQGAIVLSPSLREVVDLWLQSSTSNGSASIGTIEGSLLDYSLPAGERIRFYTSNFSLVSFVPEVNVNGFIYNNTIAFCATNINDYTYNALANKYYYGVEHSGGYTISQQFVNVGGKQYLYYADTVSKAYSYPICYDVSDLFDSMASAIAAYLSGSLSGYAVSTLDVNQITDTSESDLLTSSNSVASDGTVDGDTTIYLPDQATLETAIDGYNEGTLSYEDFLKIFGINSVASDATVQEKEDALTVVVTPSEDYLWFTKTQWGADSLEETRKASAVTRSEEDSLANSIANTLNGGSDPEPDEDGKSRGKGLLALLLLGLGIWNTPIIAGDGTPSSGGTDDGSTDGSGDTSGYLQQSIAGMAVAGGIVEDLFSAAGGSDGYGLAYTVGASFVIFSVIIGAANYFGALFSGSDTKQNIKSSGKQTRSKSPSPKSKKGG